MVSYIELVHKPYKFRAILFMGVFEGKNVKMFLSVLEFFGTGIKRSCHKLITLPLE